MHERLQAWVGRQDQIVVPITLRANLYTLSASAHWHTYVHTRINAPVLEPSALCAHTYTHTYTHTPPSSRFLLVLFVSPCRATYCSTNRSVNKKQQLPVERSMPYHRHCNMRARQWSVPYDRKRTRQACGVVRKASSG